MKIREAHPGSRKKNDPLTREIEHDRAAQAQEDVAPDRREALALIAAELVDSGMEAAEADADLGAADTVEDLAGHEGVAGAGVEDGLDDGGALLAVERHVDREEVLAAARRDRDRSLGRREG